MNISYKTANSLQDFEVGRKLFQEYACSLNFDLSFQDFSKELETIDTQYRKPRGALILAFSGRVAIGCTGIREWESDIAELKRMYIQPEYRKYGIGRKLLELGIETAQVLKYNKIRLDTLPDMTQAINLYLAFGFYEIPAYRFNPNEGTVYMEKNIAR